MWRSIERSNRQIQNKAQKLTRCASSRFRYRNENATIQTGPDKNARIREQNVPCEADHHESWFMRKSHATDDCLEPTLNAFEQAVDETI